MKMMRRIWMLILLSLHLLVILPRWLKCIRAAILMKLMKESKDETLDTYSKLLVEEKEVYAKSMMKFLVAVHKVVYMRLSFGFLEVLSRGPNLLHRQLPLFCKGDAIFSSWCERIRDSQLHIIKTKEIHEYLCANGRTGREFEEIITLFKECQLPKCEKPFTRIINWVLRPGGGLYGLQTATEHQFIVTTMKEIGMSRIYLSCRGVDNISLDPH